MEKKQQLLKVVPWLISKVLLKLHDKQGDLRGRQKQNFFRGYSWRKGTQGTHYQLIITQKLVSLIGSVDFSFYTRKSDFLFNLHMQVCNISVLANFISAQYSLCQFNLPVALFLKPKQKSSSLESQEQKLSKTPQFQLLMC